MAEDTKTVDAQAPAEAKTEDKTDRAKAFVLDVLEERGLNADSIKGAVTEAVKPLESRMKTLEESTLKRLGSTDEAVPGLKGSPEAKQFNMLHAIRGQLTGRWDGAEATRDVLKAAEKTDMYQRVVSTTTDSSAGFWIPPEVLGDTVEKLRAQSVLGQLGVRRLPNLTKWPIHIPTQTGDVTAYWIGEGEAPTESGVTTGLIESRPKKVGTYTTVTKEALAYSDPSIEQFIRESIVAQIQLELDESYFLGSGVDGEPLGLANVTGINTEAYSQPATSAAIPSTLLSMLAGIIADLDGSYVTNPARWQFVFNSDVKEALTKITDGDGRPWWTWDPRMPILNNPLLGYPYTICNKLDTSSNIADIFFLDPYETIWAEWAGMLIEANPYALGKYQKVEIYGFQMVDFVCRQPKAVCLMNDFNVTLTPAA